MRRLLIVIVSFVLVSAMASCGGTSTDSFDSTLLYGKWNEGTVFERYDSGGTGATWDTADDISEEEGQPFSWSLEGSTLIQEHNTTFGSVVPKVYTVTELTYSTLKYHDDYGTSHSFTKN